MKRLLPAVLLLCAGCVAPARSLPAYEADAVAAAEASLSAVETGRLTANAAGDGNAPAPYVAVVLEEAEEAASWAHDTFASIQPPDARADALRSELAPLLARATDGLAQLRIAARRGEVSELPRIAEPLSPIARELDAFIAEHE